MATAPSGPKELPAPAQLMRMLAGKWITVAIGTAAELGIADLLANSDSLSKSLPQPFRVIRPRCIDCSARWRASGFSRRPKRGSLL